jgi:hypothetical protein
VLVARESTGTLKTVDALSERTRHQLFLSPRMVITVPWCSRRSRMAVATTGSTNTVPHSATVRFEVNRMAPRS